MMYLVNARNRVNYSELLVDATDEEDLRNFLSKERPDLEIMSMIPVENRIFLTDIRER